MKLGIIQSRGLGDIIIAAPIAQFYIDQGHDVFWPIDSGFYKATQAAFPQIQFIEIDPIFSKVMDSQFFLEEPMRLLRNIGVDRIVSLYSYLSNLPIVNKSLANSLKFDEYKYAISDVPFVTKWKLKINRNPDRERALVESLNCKEKYILIHNTGSNFKADIKFDNPMGLEIRFIDERTTNPFDWLGAIENAAETHFIDSCFANLNEQLFSKPRSFVYLRSSIEFTPVFIRQRIRSP